MKYDELTATGFCYGYLENALRDTADDTYKLKLLHLKHVMLDASEHSWKSEQKRITWYDTDYIADQRRTYAQRSAPPLSRDREERARGKGLINIKANQTHQAPSPVLMALPRWKVLFQC